MGTASWYGPGFHGRRTANGERFDQDAMTAAHRKWAFGTRVRVTLLSTGRSVVLTVNDRIPRKDRIIDVSRGAARALGLIGPGIGKVRLEVVRAAGQRSFSHTPAVIPHSPAARVSPRRSAMSPRSRP